MRLSPLVSNKFTRGWSFWHGTWLDRIYETTGMEGISTVISDYIHRFEIMQMKLVVTFVLKTFNPTQCLAIQQQCQKETSLR